MKAIKFCNFTDTDFTWNYDGIPYEFPAHAEIFLEDYKAEHFAKHLVDREMNAQGVVTDNKAVRDQLTTKCFPSNEIVTPMEAVDIEEKKKVTGKKKAVEEEFEDLNDK